ncbi:hypothetical protein GCM10023144_07250 [Pigmentiphaga soli]|uniref:Transposase IS4-like domain-containing protein n=1 Tax=Pigmentiphaga soli TaxID=1007095 RepID=A0ABP8GIU1_9BURK
MYGYKLHANADARHKLIRQAKITAANVDDGRTLKDVLDRGNTGRPLLADRGYDAQSNRELLQKSQLRDGIARSAQNQVLKGRVALRGPRKLARKPIRAGPLNSVAEFMRAHPLKNGFREVPSGCAAWSPPQRADDV